MNKQIEIEEMARDLCECYVEKFGGYSVRFVLDAEKTAEKMTAKGYRKSTDMVREIFEEIVKAIAKGVSDGNEMVANRIKDFAFREVLKHTGEMYADSIGKCICEVFKKYESEGADDDN